MLGIVIAPGSPPMGYDNPRYSLTEGMADMTICASPPGHPLELVSLDIGPDPSTGERSNSESLGWARKPAVMLSPMAMMTLISSGRLGLSGCSIDSTHTSLAEDG